MSDRKTASRAAARNAAFVTNKIKGYKKSGVSHDIAKILAHMDLDCKKVVDEFKKGV